jgi:hypothetical protein
MSILSKDFKKGYRDGYGQATENIRSNIIDYLNEHETISIDMVNDICDFCAVIDEDYLNQ